MHREFPHLEDAAQVYDSLPSVGRDPVSDRRYGLVWRSEELSGGLRPEHRVGLSIAGIRHVEDQEALVRVSDELTGIIASLALEESNLELNPTAVVNSEVEIAAYTAWLVDPVEKGFAVPNDVTIEVLRREPARMVFIGERVALEGYWLRPYRNVRSSIEFLEIVHERSLKARRSPVLTSALTLIQTIDYLSLVVAKEQLWKSPKPMVNAPDLQSAAQLAAKVSDLQDFTTALIGTSNVIDRLEIPEIPLASSHGAPKRRRGSLGRLEYWLLERVSEQASRDRIADALIDIRDVITLRHLSAHHGDDTRKRAAASLHRLGLPNPILDYSRAWGQLQAVLANAFDTIRVEVQTQPKKS